MSSSATHINSFEQITEIYYSEVLAGKPETIRLRLIDAMESLGFDIIEDQPYIIGRREARRWGKWYSSADVLEYASTLTIRFRNVTDTSSRVTFDYLIKHGWINEGEKKIVVQEARTIAALARVPAISKMCSVCGIDTTDDSKFCRSCGAPLTSESSELEVLRLLAETRAAKSSVVTNSIITPLALGGLVTSLILSLTGFGNPKVIVTFAIISTVAMLFSIFISFFGWNRLKRALNTPEQKQLPGRRYTGETLDNIERSTLSEPPPYTSITEGTTNLLDAEWTKSENDDKVAVFKSRKTKELE